MSVLTICSCYLRIKDQLGNAYSSAELVFEPRKSQVNSGDALYLSKPKRATVVPAKTIQDITYFSVSPSPLTPVTVTYTGGGTAGSEIVTVTGTDISVQIQSGVSTATQIKTAVAASTAAAAVLTPVITGTAGNTQTTVSATTLSDDYALLALAETTTNSQQSIFILNWNDGNNYSSIIFDPIQIPNQSAVDLSTILTVSRG